MSDILQQVVEVVVEQLGVEAGQVKPESHFIEDLGADSLDTVELLMALEEKFDCEIDEASAEKLTRVSDIVDFIKTLETA
ncbi:MAG: acyl carrier protein [Bermanella sp.]|nr:acyl carrier protein [Bermanella sp.]